MTIEQCYEKLGGSFAQVCRRLPGRGFVERFFVRYLEDDSAQLLDAAVKAGDAGEVMRLALALKGLAGNLGFGHLEQAVTRLVEQLHDSCGVLTAEAAAQAETVRRCHRETTEILQMYLIERRI